MIKNVTNKTVEAVRERERERERVNLTKLCSINHAQKLSKKYIRIREIGYEDSAMSYV